MDKNTASSSIRKLNTEIFSLNPSAIISLFEIDISSIGFSRGIISSQDVDNKVNTIFRFHNSVNLTNSSIWWQGNEYIAAPIMAEGFETSIRGTSPTPRLSITVSDEGIPHLAMFKQRMFAFSYDLVGAKVTRIRTLASFLDAQNFPNSIVPNNFSPDPNAEFPRDVFYIDRKSAENKNIIEFELASLLDVEGVKLPGRLVISNSCNFAYRGEGCCYEYSGRKNISEHLEDSVLPIQAPPCATERDEKFIDLFPNALFTDKGRYVDGEYFKSGDYCYVSHNNLNYYFVAKKDGYHPSPPHGVYWVADQCSKTAHGCMLRYGSAGTAKGNVTPGYLPFGGFPCVNRFR